MKFSQFVYAAAASLPVLTVFSPLVLATQTAQTNPLVTHATSSTQMFDAMEEQAFLVGGHGTCKACNRIVLSAAETGPSSEILAIHSRLGL